MLDVLPKLLIELRDDDAVDAIVHGRVRGYEPAPDTIDPNSGAVLEQGDARGPGQYVAFVVLVRLDSPRDKRSVGQYPRIAVRCYGRTRPEAFALYAACSDALHGRGPRIHNNGLGIYLSWDDTGSSQEKDPVTDQPYEEFIASLIATTQAVAS
ncbi:MAG TPA: hypothetical protein VFV72_02560 [Candidatus Limnocylindrales bacterium]|nr:hypothetical protein [Candidatus Limnocylindrales bacterium]